MLDAFSYIPIVLKIMQLVPTHYASLTGPIHISPRSIATLINLQHPNC